MKKWLALAILGFTGMLMANEYPTRNIEVIVPYSAGGGTDLVARTFTEFANKHLSHNMGVVNKAGGGGAVGLTEIVRARPNGYKIGIGTVELAMLPHLGLVNWKATDVTPIAVLNVEPSAISVNATSEWQTYEEFIQYARNNPGKVRIGNSGTGAIWHIAAEALGDKTGVTFTHIPYAGANPAVTDLLGNHIEAVTVSPAEVLNHVRNGTVRILAIMAEQRVEQFPEVPTLKELNVDLSISTWRGVVVPNDTPEHIRQKLSDVAEKVSLDSEYVQTLEKMNVTPVYLNAKQFSHIIEKDNQFFADIMKKLGISK